MQNEEAAHPGLITRAFRGASQIAREAAVLVLGGSLVYQLVGSSILMQSNAEENSTSSRGAQAAATGVIIIGVIGGVSLASVIGNLCQIRRMVR